MLQQRRDLTWASPEIKHLDHLYSSLDPAQGLYWAYEQLGVVERQVTDADIERFVHKPPEDTRAWTRAQLLRIGGDAVYDVDWDQIKFRKTGRGYWPTLRTVHLANPLGFTRSAMKDIIGDGSCLDDILDILHASPPAIDATPSLTDWGRHHAAPAKNSLATGNGGSHRGWDEC